MGLNVGCIHTDAIKVNNGAAENCNTFTPKTKNNFICFWFGGAFLLKVAPSVSRRQTSFYHLKNIIILLLEKNQLLKSHFYI